VIHVIAYRDFVPQQLQAPGLLSAGEYETFDAAVAATNEWLQQERVKVLHVETVVLPSIWDPHEAGTQDAALLTREGGYWHQFVRVWYEEG
jgi:hypothetical protein